MPDLPVMIRTRTSLLLLMGRLGTRVKGVKRMGSGSERTENVCVLESGIRKGMRSGVCGEIRD